MAEQQRNATDLPGSPVPVEKKLLDVRKTAVEDCCREPSSHNSQTSPSACARMLHRVGEEAVYLGGPLTLLLPAFLAPLDS